MNAPISVRLDDSVRATLEAEAKHCGIGLATYLRQLAADAARDARRRRIRAHSDEVARHIATNPEARDFADFWGTPRSEGLFVPAFAAGDIVIADWRGDALPKEPNKLRPAVVIQDEALFGPAYPNVILVPLTEDAGLGIQGLVEPIEPTTENGCSKPCFALAPFVASISTARVRATQSRITADQLARIRRQVAEAIGLE